MRRSKEIQENKLKKHVIWAGMSLGLMVGLASQWGVSAADCTPRKDYCDMSKVSLMRQTPNQSETNSNIVVINNKTYLDKNDPSFSMFANIGIFSYTQPDTPQHTRLPTYDFMNGAVMPRSLQNKPILPAELSDHDGIFVCNLADPLIPMCD